LYYAYEMNEHVTRGLRTNNERGIEPVPGPGSRGANHRGAKIRGANSTEDYRL
jgi:hypothetical protein